MKTFLYRSVGVFGSRGGRPRWCAIVDPKGEYGPLADGLGLEQIRLHPGGTSRLNPLDTFGATEDDEIVVRRIAMVAAQHLGDLENLTQKQLLNDMQSCKPWRSYAANLLWRSLSL